MRDLQLTIDDRRTIGDYFAMWGPRIGVAALFFFVGWSKFSTHGTWVRLFATIGVGQWFRIFTGVLQVGGAVLVLVPPTAWIGAALLSCTMAGAVFVQVAVLHTGLLAIAPAILMVVTAAVCAQARGWL